MFLIVFILEKYFCFTDYSILYLNNRRVFVVVVVFLFFVVAFVGLFLFVFCKKKITPTNLFTIISQLISHVFASDCMSLIRSESLQIKSYLYT